MDRFICTSVEGDAGIPVRRLGQRYWVGLLLGLLIVILSLVGAEWGLLGQERLRQEDAARERVALDLSRLLAFYRQIADGLAGQARVREALLGNERAGAEDWARQARALLPGVLGLALIDGAGEVMGEVMDEAVGLGLTEACRHDLDALRNGEGMARPSVHRDVGTGHFDLTSPIKGENGEVLGRVFVSFGLDLLARWVEGQGDLVEYALVEDGRGRTVAETGLVRDRMDHHGAGHRWSAVPGTDWRLHMMSPASEPRPLLLSLVVALLGVFALGAILWALRSRLIDAFHADLRILGESLRIVQSGEGREQPFHPRLQETCVVLDAISRLGGTIDGLRQESAQCSVTDELTGLLNRRGFMQAAGHCLQLAQRGIPHTLILFDLDDFKSCNAALGHTMGDQVLQLFAAALSGRVRETDLCARIGGDEFVVILVNDTSDSLQGWFRDIKEAFLRLQLKLGDGIALERCCTCSAGVVSMAGYDSLTAVLHRADARMRRHKREGGDLLDAARETNGGADGSATR